MDDASSPSNVTLTILDVSLSLVHIPRSRLAELSRPILKQLLRKSPKFLNLTANEIELSIFAEDDELEDFEPIAREDRRRQKRMQKVASKALAVCRRSRNRTSESYETFQSVEISFEKWRVLQIDSHEDSLNQFLFLRFSTGNSGSRVRELSAPLAAAGISILYQSSYLSDFIFVKASRLAEVMKLLDAAGFSLYNADPFDNFSSMSTGVFDSFNDQSLAQLRGVANAYASRSGSPGTMSPAVLSRTRSPSMASLTALSYAMSGTAGYEPMSSSVVMMMHKSKLSNLATPSTTLSSTRTPKKSLSPTAATVEVLAPDIACVGLSENAVDLWSLKIITLVGYPELIPTPASASSSSLSFPQPPQSRADTPPDAVLDSALDPEESVALKNSSFHDFRPNRYLDDPSSQNYTSPESSSSCSSSEDDEEYFSSPSPYNRKHDGSTPSLVSATSRSSARSLPDQLSLRRKSNRPMLAHLSKLATLADIPRQISASPSPTEHVLTERTREGSTNKIAGAAPPRVSFFSFTRTAEGSSLTTDLGVLAALFAHDERHMVICSGSLLDEGDALNKRAADDERFSSPGMQNVFSFEDAEDLFVMDETDDSAPGTLKCLQTDLQKFGLNKHGLVNRFSRVLEDNGINHMYSSTYKTANLLVDKANAIRAQSLLRSC
ncbi:hypothetical protein EW145_g70 [Phellinidium pouzarii]|uniref:CASTOR ACT domain-containing protein n=1 Tax=Phellinidium pouzarii TaxID=167371 RepID=A0A4S4LKG6_9AGAM|nr:hypothetical protein EW145_g70 [Phellinidium pouzarii]